jgi:hypothetical protein
MKKEGEKKNKKENGEETIAPNALENLSTT